jgi:hypothetical protein
MLKLLSASPEIVSTIELKSVQNTHGSLFRSNSVTLQKDMPKVLPKTIMKIPILLIFQNKDILYFIHLPI